MAASVVAELPSEPQSTASSVAIPLQHYAADDDSAEQALPESTEAMESQSQLRSRQQRQRSGSTSRVREGREPEIETTLASGPEDTGEKPRGRPAAWRRFFQSRVPNPLSSAPSNDAVNVTIDRGYQNFKHEKLESYTKGIPRYAALQHSNDSFSVHRKFGPYAARVLLHRELELDELVKRLNALDAEDATKVERRYRVESIQHQKGWPSDKKDLIDELEDRLSRYYDFLFKYVEIKALQQPTPRHIRAVYDWMVDNRPLEVSEQEYIFHLDDMILARKDPERRSLQGGRIEDFLESWISRSPKSWIANIFKTEDERRKTKDPYVHHFSSNRLAICANAITVFLAVGGLLVPVFLLFLVPMHRGVMATVALGFVLVFSVTMSVVTGARVQDVLVGTAAYGAVVIMFLGNLNQSPGTK